MGREDRTGPTLFDFVAAPEVPKRIVPIRRSDPFRERYFPMRSEGQVLAIGRMEPARIAECVRRREDLLLMGIDEAAAAAARKEGFRAILGNPENLPDRGRFAAVILEDPTFPLYDPDRVLGRIAASLAPGGKAYLELGCAGNMAGIREAIVRVGRSEGVVVYLHQDPEPGRWIDALQRLRGVRHEAQVRHRSVLLEGEKLESELRREFALALGHLDRDVRVRIEDRIRRIVTDEVGFDGVCERSFVRVGLIRE
ncbi:hypothetical protein [Nitratifractor sp.]